MLFRNRPPDVDFNVFIEHERINRVHVTKFLGIYIDDKLNWKYHINTVRSKLSKVAAIIYRASCLINQDGIYMLYCSLLLPYINYCSEIWGNTYCTNVECITALPHPGTRPPVLWTGRMPVWTGIPVQQLVVDW